MGSRKVGHKAKSWARVAARAVFSTAHVNRVGGAWNGCFSEPSRLVIPAYAGMTELSTYERLSDS